jgi:alpha-mannosidase
MGYEAVIAGKLDSLARYRTAIRWQSCYGAYDGLDALTKASVIWRDTHGHFEVPDGQEGWFRCRYRVPPEVEGIATAGSQIALRCNVICPTAVYLGGEKVFEERFWTDFQMPEIILSRKAVPGELIEIVVNLKGSCPLDPAGARTSIWAEIEAVEDIAFELGSFQHELEFCSQFPELKDDVANVATSASQEIHEGLTAHQILAIVHSLRRRLAHACAFTKEMTVHLVAHAHIDMNWLWDMEDTIDVCRRDFGTMLELIDEFPGYVFSQSQTAVYDIAEQNFPEIFAGMKQAVAEGKWDVTAATWTEGDLNLANGESVLRHVLYSHRYLTARFGVRSRIAWEPDTFGHPANIPQLLAKSGVPYYYHMRTSEGGPRFFHEENPLYLWEGLDGSRILAFTSHYGGAVHPAAICRIARKLSERNGLKHSMFVYGVGDHGGGPTRKDLKRALLLDSFPTMPRLEFSSCHAFFDAVSEKLPDNVPVWKGEMNPIFDGCYTSHTDIKRYNRLGENRLLEAESASALARIAGANTESDSARTGLLEECWRTLCFNQFHDILDGCAIHSTYQLAGQQMSRVLSKASEMTNTALWIPSSSIGTRSDLGRPVAVWNLLGFKRTDIVEIQLPIGMDSCTVLDAQGRPVPFQLHEDWVFFLAEDVPAMGYRTYYLSDEPSPPASDRPRETDTLISLHSPYLEVDVDKRSGCIVRVLDRTSGHLMLHQRDWYEIKTFLNNLFQVDYEVPHGMSAWIIGAISRTERCVRDAKVRIAASGPVMDVVEIEHRVGSSTVRQDMVFYRVLKRIDFRTDVQWQEIAEPTCDAPMLRVSFTPELKKPSVVTWDIPFGNVRRVADGTEYPAQKWIDVSDEDFGFSVVNDCRYGFSAQGNTLTMTCVRTSCAPDPRPDKRHHEFSYALYPHSGDWRSARTPEVAASFNSPLTPVLLTVNPSGSLATERGWLEIDGNGVLMTCLKPGPEPGTVVFRLLEHNGTEHDCSVRLHFPVKSLHEVSPVETDVIAPVENTNGTFRMQLKPYELKTFLVGL